MTSILPTATSIGAPPRSKTDATNAHEHDEILRHVSVLADIITRLVITPITPATAPWWAAWRSAELLVRCSERYPIGATITASASNAVELISSDATVQTRTYSRAMWIGIVWQVCRFLDHAPRPTEGRSSVPIEFRRILSRYCERIQLHACVWLRPIVRDSMACTHTFLLDHICEREGNWGYNDGVSTPPSALTQWSSWVSILYAWVLARGGELCPTERHKMVFVAFSHMWQHDPADWLKDESVRLCLCLAMESETMQTAYSMLTQVHSHMTTKLEGCYGRYYPWVYDGSRQAWTCFAENPGVFEIACIFGNTQCAQVGPAGDEIARWCIPAAQWSPPVWAEPTIDPINTHPHVVAWCIRSGNLHCVAAGLVKYIEWGGSKWGPSDLHNPAVVHREDWDRVVYQGVLPPLLSRLQWEKIDGAAHQSSSREFPGWCARLRALFYLKSMQYTVRPEAVARLDQMVDAAHLARWQRENRWAAYAYSTLRTAAQTGSWWPPPVVPDEWPLSLYLWHLMGNREVCPDQLVHFLFWALEPAVKEDEPEECRLAWQHLVTAMRLWDTADPSRVVWTSMRVPCPTAEQDAAIYHDTWWPSISLLTLWRYLQHYESQHTGWAQHSLETLHGEVRAKVSSDVDAWMRVRDRPSAGERAGGVADRFASFS